MKPYKIIIIDDVVEICDFYKVIIEKNMRDEFVSVDTYYDAEEGLRRIYRNSFDMAVIDVELNNNEINGLSLARECLLMGKPIIINTATGWSNKWMFYLKNSDLQKNVMYLQKDINNPMKILDAVKKLKGKTLNLYEKGDLSQSVFKIAKVF